MFYKQQSIKRGDTIMENFNAIQTGSDKLFQDLRINLCYLNKYWIPELKPLYMYVQVDNTKVTITPERPKITQNEISGMTDLFESLENTSVTAQSNIKKLTDLLGKNGKVVLETYRLVNVEATPEQLKSIAKDPVKLLEYGEAVRDRILTAVCSQIITLNKIKSYVHQDIGRYADTFINVADRKLLPTCAYLPTKKVVIEKDVYSSIHSKRFSKDDYKTHEANFKRRTDKSLPETIKENLSDFGPLLAGNGLVCLGASFAMPFIAPAAAAFAVGITALYAMDYTVVENDGGKEKEVLRSTLRDVATYTQTKIVDYVDPVTYRKKEITLVQDINNHILKLIKMTKIANSPLDKLSEPLNLDEMQNPSQTVIPMQFGINAECLSRYAVQPIEWRKDKNGISYN